MGPSAQVLNHWCIPALEPIVRCFDPELTSGVKLTLIASSLLWGSVAPVNPGTPDGNIGGKRKLARKHACVKHLDRFLVLCSIADGPLGGDA